MSTAFGVLILISVVPGAVVLIVERIGAVRSSARYRGGERMTERPYVTLSCAMSIDGYLDSAMPRRLAMSNAADLDRVDQVRADNDAIMVGASTVRRDDPRLLVKSEQRRMRRRAEGRPSSPIKVTVTSSGELSPDAAFFSAGEGDKLVYCPLGRARRLRDQLGDSGDRDRPR